MLFSITKNPVLYSIYKYDNDLFVNMFCENKNRPKMNCNGKCKLAKMQKDEAGKEAANTLKQLQCEVFYYHPANSFFIVDYSIRFVEIITQTGYFSNLYSFLYNIKLFKPPDTLVVIS